MSKSKQKPKRITQTFRRHGRSLPAKPLDIERGFIDDLMFQVEFLIRSLSRFIGIL